MYPFPSARACMSLPAHMIPFFRNDLGRQGLGMGAQLIWATWDIRTSARRHRIYRNSRSYHCAESCRVHSRSDICRRTSLNRPDRER
ncbi:unnamed protein product [Tuber aestivum]|uniref:Uncharacterized protein n=1 Tax=Tuber aestivum TaxID=59557 RepID=A0A292PWN9_9PEZI|nr:unnamed protein product [Tuber aestivum]